MRYAVWNNKGGVGKTFLSFVLGTEIAHTKPNHKVLLVDMCPQANLSEIVLPYGIGGDSNYQDASFKSKAERFGMPLPKIHSVLLNRSTWYSDKASKAFGAMFKEIKRRTTKLFNADKARFMFVGKKFWFHEIPDSHSVAIVCSHLGKPLYQVTPGKVMVHDENVQVNSEPLNRYKKAVAEFLAAL